MANNGFQALRKSPLGQAALKSALGQAARKAPYLVMNDFTNSKFYFINSSDFSVAKIVPYPFATPVGLIGFGYNGSVLWAAGATSAVAPFNYYIYKLKADGSSLISSFIDPDNTPPAPSTTVRMAGIGMDVSGSNLYFWNQYNNVANNPKLYTISDAGAIILSTSRVPGAAEGGTSLAHCNGDATVLWTTGTGVGSRIVKRTASTHAPLATGAIPGGGTSPQGICGSATKCYVVNARKIHEIDVNTFAIIRSSDAFSFDTFGIGGGGEQ